jgi:hypothetical protein
MSLFSNFLEGKFSEIIDFTIIHFPGRKLEKGRFSGLYVLGRTMKTEVLSYINIVTQKGAGTIPDTYFHSSVFIVLLG